MDLDELFEILEEKYKNNTSNKLLPSIHLNHFFNCKHDCVSFQKFLNHFQSKGKVNDGNLVLISSKFEIVDFFDAILHLACYDFCACRICRCAVYQILGKVIHCKCNTEEEMLRNYQCLSTYYLNRSRGKECDIDVITNNNLTILAFNKLNVKDLHSETNALKYNVYLNEPPAKIQNCCTEPNDTFNKIDLTALNASDIDMNATYPSCGHKKLFFDIFLAKMRLIGMASAIIINTVRKQNRKSVGFIDIRTPPSSTYTRCAGHSLKCSLCKDNPKLYLQHDVQQRKSNTSLSNIKDYFSTCKISDTKVEEKRMKSKKKYKNDIAEIFKQLTIEEQNVLLNRKIEDDEQPDTIPVVEPERRKRNRKPRDNLKVADCLDINLVHVGSQENSHIRRSWLRKYANGHSSLNDVKSKFGMRKSTTHKEDDDWEKKFSEILNNHFSNTEMSKTEEQPSLPSWMNSEEYYELHPVYL